MSPGPARVTMVVVSERASEPVALRQPVATSPTVPVRAPTPPLLRLRSGRFVAGVAGGIAEHLGVRVLWVRIAFVVLAGLNGAGVLAYGLLWIFVRQEQVDVARAIPRAERQQAIGLAALGIAVGIAGSAAGNSVAGWIIGPLGVAAIGAAVVWREADEAQRRRWTTGARTGLGGRSAVWRVIAGAVFVAGGIAVFLFGSLQLGQIQFALLAVVATLVGVAVLTVPWWLSWCATSARSAASASRAERAEIAAHLHDSVLQTLALIQRQSATRHARCCASPAARSGSCGHWLYGPAGYGRRKGLADPGVEGGLAAAIAAAAAEVEDDLRGRRPAGRRRRPPRSTTTCARSSSPPARPWSTRPSTPGSTRSSVYVEAESPRTGDERFVRDRGAASTPTRCPRTGTASRTPSRPASPATAAPCGCAARPARAPRCICACPVPTARDADHHPERASEIHERARPADDPPASSSSTTTRSSAAACAPSSSRSVADVTSSARPVRSTRPSPRSRHRRPDVVLLDVHMPDGGGAEVLRRVRPEMPEVVFLALSVSDAAEDVIAVIRAGARGYVTKTISGRELADAVRRVRSGDAVFSPRLAGFVLDVFSDRPGAAPPGDPELDLLTRRERDVLRLLARGYAYKEIAAELFISVKTVETHVSSVLRKTQLSNRYELSRWASDRRLV